MIVHQLNRNTGPAVRWDRVAEASVDLALQGFMYVCFLLIAIYGGGLFLYAALLSLR